MYFVLINITYFDGGNEDDEYTGTYKSTDVYTFESNNALMLPQMLWITGKPLKNRNGYMKQVSRFFFIFVPSKTEIQYTTINTQQ